MQSFYLDNTQSAIVVIQDGSYPMTLGLPVAGDPTSLGDHVDPVHREAAQTPQSPEAYQDYLAALPKPEPPPELTVKEKLSALGITIEDLKAELGLAAAAPAVSEPAPVEPEWSAMTKAEIAAYCQDTFGETLDTNQLKDELIARAHELWVIANS